MNVHTFFEHYGIHENPFRAEEALQDAVFDRVEGVCHHPDFEKIRGDFDHPATAIVFGEKGSGKTAMRLQIEQSVAEHNRASADQRCLAIPYDDLNPVLDRFARHQRSRGPDEALEQFRLIDHMDAILNAIVPGIVDQMLGELRGRDPVLIHDEQSKRGPRLDQRTRHDLMMLQLCYDDPDNAAQRTGRLKRALRYRSANGMNVLRWSAVVLAAAVVAGTVWFLLFPPAEHGWVWVAVLIVLGVAAAGLAGRFGWLWFRTQQMASELARHLRVLDRPAASFRRSLVAINTEEARAAHLPRGESDEPRYAMFGRLLEVIRPFGYRSMIVLVDRIDEPTMISGEPKRMQALLWPLLNNKFLQQRHIGIKLLLPLELRYLLNREGPEFFREARLDKQNFIERLTWSGATLYDLCTARINACRDRDAEPISIMELFDEGITHQDLVDVLDQMQQPRDAFKFLYALVQEHCSNVPEEKAEFKIARPTLDAVRKVQAERVQTMLRGVRPA